MRSGTRILYEGVGARSVVGRTLDKVATFDEHRSLLFAIAYRMIGTVMDAEDLDYNVNTGLRCFNLQSRQNTGDHVWMMYIQNRKVDEV